ncbi:MAG: hypothetical protein LBH53_01205 [Puniceicoccales bacterium]|jgi:hypothetical protein|nr:hypothetical protein [Puniceicoccales bacterium]
MGPSSTDPQTFNVVTTKAKDARNKLLGSQFSRREIFDSFRNFGADFFSALWIAYFGGGSERTDALIRESLKTTFSIVHDDDVRMLTALTRKYEVAVNILDYEESAKSVAPRIEQAALGRLDALVESKRNAGETDNISKFSDDELDEIIASNSELESLANPHISIQVSGRDSQCTVKSNDYVVPGNPAASRRNFLKAIVNVIILASPNRPILQEGTIKVFLHSYRNKEIVDVCEKIAPATGSDGFKLEAADIKCEMRSQNIFLTNMTILMKTQIFGTGKRKIVGISGSTDLLIARLPSAIDDVSVNYTVQHFTNPDAPYAPKIAVAEGTATFHPIQLRKQR